MTLIQTLLKDQQSSRFKFDKAIGECLNLAELDLFLHNMDKTASIYQENIINEQARDNIIILQKQNENLLKLLKQKISSALAKTGMLREDIMYNANRLRNILEDEICNPDIERSRAVRINKAYLVAKIIAENIHNLSIEKAL